MALKTLFYIYVLFVCAHTLAECKNKIFQYQPYSNNYKNNSHGEGY